MTGCFSSADCLSSKATLDKYEVSFLVDPEAYIDTLKHITDVDADLYIPCHAAPCKRDELRELADINIRKVFEIKDKVLKIIETPKTSDEILKEIFEDYNLEVTYEQHALIGTTIRSYLSWLEKDGKAGPVIEDSFIKWVRA